MTRINLGCWHFKIPGWVNIDADPDVGPDLVADALHLPYGPETVDEIYAGHLLEHIHPRDLDSALLEWKRVLKPGGTLTVTVPDVVAATSMYTKGEQPMAWLYGVVFGADDREMQRHHNLFDPKSLKDTLSRHFGEVEEVINTPLAPYHVGWQTTAKCRKI